MCRLIKGLICAEQAGEMSLWEHVLRGAPQLVHQPPRPSFRSKEIELKRSWTGGWNDSIVKVGAQRPSSHICPGLMERRGPPQAPQVAGCCAITHHIHDMWTDEDVNFSSETFRFMTSAVFLAERVLGSSCTCRYNQWLVFYLKLRGEKSSLTSLFLQLQLPSTMRFDLRLIGVERTTCCWHTLKQLFL